MQTSTLTQVRQEIEIDRPRHARALLSPNARARAIERGILGLYRWYSEHSQRRRNWNADTCIDWRLVRRDHSDAVGTIVEGFFAVEQYTPDYVGPLLALIRESYGRSQWHVRWGAEEVRHSDLWRNAVLALGRRTEAWMDEYAGELRRHEWRLPWDSPRHIVFYQVIQERATEISYLNLGLAVSGRQPRLQTPVDDALTSACRLIAVDEAAHYHFFVEVARLLLYYEPEQSVEAFVDVLRHFTMPARDIIPGYDTFGRVLHESGVFGRTIHYNDVVRAVLDTLSAPALRQLEAGVRQAREIPLTDGARRTAAYLDTLNRIDVERKVSQLFRRNASHLERAGSRSVLQQHIRARLGVRRERGCMNMNPNPVWSALDGFQADLSSSDAPSAMRRLVASLAHSHAAMAPDAWTASCAAIDSHPALARLSEDPYSRDARLKPAGYAGDARTLDYVYLRDAGAQPISPAGRSLFAVSTGASIADAVRERSVLLAAGIASRAADRTLAIASIACGHARELDPLPSSVRDRIRYWGIDQDAKSVASCQSRHDSTGTMFTTASVKDVLTGRVRIPSSDVVYASGLFDYLDQRAGAALIRRMFGALNAGGSVLVPNLTPQNEEVGYMEALMDWWMHYRTEADMEQLAATVSLDPAVASTTTYSTSSGRIAWLRIDRIG